MVNGFCQGAIGVERFAMVIFDADVFEVRQPLHYGFCPLVKLTFKDLAKLTAFAAIFKTKTYFR